MKTSSPGEAGGGRSSDSKIGRGLVNCGTRVLLGLRSVQRAAIPPPADRPTPPTSLRSAGGEVMKTPSPGEAGGGRSSDSKVGRGQGEQRVAGVIGTAFCATRGEPSPDLSADPSHFASLRGRGGYKNLLPRRSRGRSIERQQDREGEGELRNAGVIGTAFCATRGEPSPGLRPTPPTSLRSAGGEVMKTPSPGEAGGGRSSDSKIGRGLVNCGTRVLLVRR